MDEHLKKLQSDFQGRVLVEQEIRTKNEHVLSTVRQIELVSGQKDQQLQEMRKNLEAAQRDLKNCQWSEEQLKLQITQLSQKVVEDEETLQKLKQQICAQWILQQQKEMENERLTRENVGLQGDLHKVQLSVLENSSELNRHREHVQLGEREKYGLRTQIEKYQQENQRLAEELQNLNQVLQQERHVRREELGRVSRQLSAQRGQMNSYHQQMQFQHNRIESLERNRAASPLRDSVFTQQPMT